MKIVARKLAYLFDVSTSPTRYVIKSSFLSFFVSIILGTLIILFLSLIGQRDLVNDPLDDGEPLTLAVFIWTLSTAVFIAPLIETYLMAWTVKVFSRFFEHIIIISIFSSLLMTIMHSYFWPIWGAFVIVSFMIYGIAYQVWSRISMGTGIVVAASIHAGHNFLVMMVLNLPFVEF